MTLSPVGERAAAIDAAVEALSRSAAAEKCWVCGCFHDAVEGLESGLAEAERSGSVEEVLRAARERMGEPEYDCRGCEVCHPPVAINALCDVGLLEPRAESSCTAERVNERNGWPPLPGDYALLRYRAPVAVCTLTDQELIAPLTRQAGDEISLVGPLQTENVGIERAVWNMVANPHIRFLVLCGADSKQAVGHLPGQSLLSLSRHGLDETGHIVGARGRRPVLRNVSREAVEHFRTAVEVIDLVGTRDVGVILQAVRECGKRDPGRAEPFSGQRSLRPIEGYVPPRMVPDPAGFFVIYPDRRRRLLCLEHYTNEGVLDAVVEGERAEELVTPAVAMGLVSRLDHAAYLGSELTRAERALSTGEAYTQDAAPEQRSALVREPSCGCESTCDGGVE
jgi:tetrahydromethanopterin S-methyltransferase subunit A